MKRTTLAFFVLSSFAAAALAQDPVKPADKAAPAQPPAGAPPMDAKAMEAMARYGTPGPEHAKLKTLAGTYDVKVIVWMDPKAPPMETTGKAEMKLVFDRYIQTEFSSDFMGMPYSGTGITGYNNALKKYQSTWADNMGTGVTTGEGIVGKDGTITFTLVGTDPLKNKNVKMKDIWKFESDKKFTTEMWGPPAKGGKDYKMMVLEYTKK
jgi:hypothetical protein